jgi:hypothetical protein
MTALLAVNAIVPAKQRIFAPRWPALRRPEEIAARGSPFVLIPAAAP